MTIEQAIQKAIEGGWKVGQSWLDEWSNDKPPYTDVLAICNMPPFWQHLGGAMGWDAKAPRGMTTFKDATGEDYWRYMWHRFIDHLAEGKDANSFFATL